ncbi:MAG: hypothetical protein JSW55_18970 [Chloroflexota bacterium]|nr:MAG: hypothetical protein JSW55_18970 [Chloroflexota bacterium]
MKKAVEQQPQAPPGVIATLTAGLELTTAHIWLIVLPIMVDLFYWLGPRLSIAQLAERNLAALLEEPELQGAVTQLIDIASQVNVLTGLSVPLIGIPALMSGAIPEKTPIPTQVYELNGAGLWLAVMVALTMVGLFLAALYLGTIGLAMKPVEEKPATLLAFGVAVLRSAVRLFGLGLIFLVILFMVWLPLLPIAFLVGILAGSMFVLVMLAGFVLVVTYLSLSVPGIVLNGRPLLRAVWESVRLVHGNALQTMNLLLIVILIGGGTNLLWQLADDGSWLTMVSIVGHAFISTALAGAVFVFYRDRWAVEHGDTAAI